jgi:hypothetical protein
MLALGNQAMGIQESKFLFAEKLTKISPYLQHFILIVDGSLTNSK